MHIALIRFVYVCVICSESLLGLSHRKDNLPIVMTLTIALASVYEGLRTKKYEYVYVV